MEKEELISQLIDFLQQDSACQQTLGCLSPKAEIGIRVATNTEIRVFFGGEQWSAQRESAPKADFVFDSTPESIAVLIAEKNLSPSQLGIKLAKQILSGDVKLSMPSNILQVTRKGYFKILSLGGKEFLQELRQHDLASLPKIVAALKKMRR